MSRLITVNCDRCKILIPQGADLYVLFNNENDRDVRMELCGGCGIAFNMFMKAFAPKEEQTIDAVTEAPTVVSTPATPAAEATPATETPKDSPTDQPVN